MGIGDQVDARGVSRGQCSLCDCLLFELGADGCCSYCLHPAPGHVNRGAPVDDHDPVPVPGPLPTLATSDNDHLENGTLSVRTIEFFVLNQEKLLCWLVALVLVVSLLFVLTLGLIIIVLLPIFLAFWFWFVCCLLFGYTTHVLVFDNEQKLMFSDLYEPIRYEQLSVAVIRFPTRIAIYAKDIPPAEFTGRCVSLQRYFLHRRVAASPKFMITLGMKNQNVPLFKEEFYRIVNLTKIAHTEPAISWEAIQADATRRISSAH